MTEPSVETGAQEVTDSFGRLSISARTPPRVNRRQPGEAYVSRSLPPRRRLLYGEGRNAGRISKDVADRLGTPTLHSFAQLRRLLWRAVAASSHAAEFTSTDHQLMRCGQPPRAATGQRVGRRVGYEIHHIRPLCRGGALYDLANLSIMTPLFHASALAPRYHFVSAGEAVVLACAAEPGGMAAPARADEVDAAAGYAGSELAAAPECLSVAMAWREENS